MKKLQTHFNLLPNEKESLKDVAWINKMSISDFIRYALKCQGVEIEELIKDRNN